VSVVVEDVSLPLTINVFYGEKNVTNLIKNQKEMTVMQDNQKKQERAKEMAELRRSQEKTHERSSFRKKNREKEQLQDLDKHKIDRGLGLYPEELVTRMGLAFL
jgi:uncharacterized membrane protein YgaE (UPF0421/DUF939 family)